MFKPGECNLFNRQTTAKQQPPSFSFTHTKFRSSADAAAAADAADAADAAHEPRLELGATLQLTSLDLGLELERI